MKSPLLSCLAAAAFALAAPASVAQAQGVASAQGVKAGTYSVDPNHTQVVAKFMHLGFNPIYIFFGEPGGSLTLDPAKLAASKVEITIPLANLRTSTDEFTKHLQSSDFFDAAKFPEIKFVSTAVKPTSALEADITGNLTVHGVTKPVTIKAKLTGQGGNPMSKAATVGFTGSTQIKRSDFGVGAYVPMVGDEIDLKITAAFEMK